ncbi:MalY/PatB family protein [Candidatus Clostridium stratigraminis]|uniref:cysteine-S-conjugate beta-lyase n=1 Tax=Candidatus Clostridium stratigraminis TaxID=3381661 RepID=A0ABW8T2P6_9CLOT
MLEKNLKYDFETVINRTNTGSAKWELMKSWNPKVSDGTVPFSVADMEFKNAPEIIEGLKTFIDYTVLGYTEPTENYLRSVCSWMKRRHYWDIKSEWIVESPGVVPAFFSAIKALTEPGDGIIIMTPVYYPFYMAMERNNRTIIKNQLIKKEDTYDIDFEDLELKAKNPKAKILLFCSPHNPIGRVWSKAELERVGEICLRNNILIISDEIHFDIIMPGFKHRVFATISEELSNNMIICTAPSKTFNLAGLQVSNIIIPNKQIREAYVKEAQSNAFVSLNILGYKGCEIAYNEGESWLEELINVIYHNHLVLKKYIEENIPKIKVFDLQGTYLQWMDFNGLGLNKDELEKLLHEAKLFFDEGYVFGEEGIGFERMNLACPTNVLFNALEKLRKLIDRN